MRSPHITLALESYYPTGQLGITLGQKPHTAKPRASEPSQLRRRKVAAKRRAVGYGAPSDSVSQFAPSSRELNFSAIHAEAHMVCYVILLLLLAASIPLSGWIAERRGRSIKLWCWMGVIFGPIAPLVVALLPPAGEPAGRPPTALSNNEPSHRTGGRASGGPGEPPATLQTARAPG